MERCDDRIAVIGGGAAGLAAAIAAARKGASVTVFEAQDRVGNSIKVTGDGRCNIANAQTCPEAYHNAEFTSRVFQACPPDDATRFLESLGLLLREEAEGRLYPITNKATSVIDALRLTASKLGVVEACGKEAVEVRRAASIGNPADARPHDVDGGQASMATPRSEGGGLWDVSFADGSQASFCQVIIACGGKVARRLLPEDLPFAPLEALLGPIATNTEPLKGLDKIRVKCSIEARGHRETGEVTFRPYGISGIAAFNMTRFVERGDALHIDFLPGFKAGESMSYLRSRLDALQPATWLDYTCGLLLPLVARAVLRAAGLSADARPTQGDIPRFHEALRNFGLTVRGLGDVRLCQVHRGGVNVEAIDSSTMEVRGAPGLFVAGEVVDVDGPCGGYNLHWAWTSGIVAGGCAAGRVPAICEQGRVRAAKGGSRHD